MNFISIIISYSGTKKTLHSVIMSILPQLAIKDEIIVIDDSESGCLSGLDNMDKIRTIRIAAEEQSKNNMVFSRNFGSEHSKNNYLLFLDEDVVPGKYTIKTYRHNIKKYGVILGGLNWQNKHLKIIYDYRFSLREYGGKIPKFPVKMNKLARHGYGGGGNMCISKNLFNMVGQFDMDYNGGWGHEDIDLLRRILKSGHDIYYDYEAIGVHQYHKRNFSGMERNGDILKSKWKDWDLKEYL